MAKILFGAPVKQEIKEELIEKIRVLGRTPVLAIVTAGDRVDTSIYLKNKQIFGQEIGVYVIIKKFADNVSESELRNEVLNLANDGKIDGIIIQLPLPRQINAENIINLVPKNKDADGLSGNTDISGTNIITPATARGVTALLDFYNIEVEKKDVVVIGRSKLAGGPIAKSLEARGANVIVCHKETDQNELPNICRKANILISATGQVGLVKKNFVNENQVVIDVGINRINVDGKIVGDVLFEEVEPLVYAITPVPGGIGLLTVASLFQNLIDLCV